MTDSPSTNPNITKHEGRKYLRLGVDPTSGVTFYTDVYAVLEAFGVTCPARAHAIKKLLATGDRGKGDEMADLIGAQAAISRAIELCGFRQELTRMRAEQAAKKIQEAQVEKIIEESKENERKAREKSGSVMSIPLDKIGAKAVEIRNETDQTMQRLELLGNQEKEL